MKPLQKAAVALTMMVMASCDEKMMGEEDASTPESCILFASPGAESDAGDGASASTPASSVDAVIKQATALQSQCGDATEVRFADGSLSEEQYGIASEALKTAGIKVGRYSVNADNVGQTSLSTNDDSLASIEKIGLQLRRCRASYQ